VSDNRRDVPWLRYTALLTGILSVAGGFLAVRSSDLASLAIFHSNQAVLYQAQASDAWAEYQANSIKARIVETATLTPVDQAARDSLATQSKEFRDRQPPLRAKAQDLEKKRDAELVRSAAHLHDKDTLAYAGVAIQLGIGLASIAALTHRFSALIGGAIAGAMGVLIIGFTFLQAFLSGH
jgi:hypothetical protein